MSLSYHHAYLSSKFSVELDKLDKYSVFSELTIQIEKDYVIDVCLYPKRKINFSSGDIVKMTELPLLAVEILSPTQGSQEIMDKFAVYFQAGIQSCWLVIPVAQSVVVYSSIENAQTFNRGEILDSVLDIKIQIEAIFG